jgi:nicotinamidase-related amidase
VIDVQNSFEPGPRWNLSNNPSFEDNVNRLIDRFRSRALLVTYGGPVLGAMHE